MTSTCAIRHDQFYFNDGNTIFQVEDVLFNVHRSVLTRHSPIFEDMFSINCGEGESDDRPIFLDGTSSLGLASLLACLYPRAIGKLPDMPPEQWVLVLDLAARWQFDTIHETALKQLKSDLHHDSRSLAVQLAAARRHALEEYYWRVLTLLCERHAPLSPEEGEQLGVREALFVAAIREKLRGNNRNQTIYQSAKRIALTDDQQRMIRSEADISMSVELGKTALDLYRPVYVANGNPNPGCLSIYE